MALQVRAYGQVQRCTVPAESCNEHFRSTRRWQRIRLLVLRRDRNVCQWRGPTCTRTATVADHVIAVADGGQKFDLANLTASCVNCNNGREGSGHPWNRGGFLGTSRKLDVGSSRVDLQACKLEYSIVSPK